MSERWRTCVSGSGLPLFRGFLPACSQTSACNSPFDHGDRNDRGRKSDRLHNCTIGRIKLLTLYLHVSMDQFLQKSVFWGQFSAVPTADPDFSMWRTRGGEDSH
jgi:hypothetical protein